MKDSIRYTLLSAIVILTMGYQNSFAKNTCVSISGASCQLQPDTRQENIIRVGAFVKHAGTNLKNINLLCPLDISKSDMSKINQLNLIYSNTITTIPFTSWSDTNYVLAKFRAVSGKGHIKTIGEVHSGTFKKTFELRGGNKGEDGYYRAVNEKAFSENIVANQGNTNPQYYFVNVQIARFTHQMHPAFSGLTLCGTK